MSFRWTVLGIVGLLTIGGCQNCGKAQREAEEAAAAAEAEAATAAESEAAAVAAAEAQRQTEAQAAAERQAEAAAAVEREARKRYVVASGDCLWYIAADRLEDGRRWPEIHAANQSMISDPDLIYPDQVLAIPVDG